MRSKVKAIAQLKCPRCRRGDLFKYSALRLGKFTEMNENCPRCQLKYQREPGFFFGALYLNYAFTVALIITVGVILSILWPDASTLAYIAIVTLLVILLLPWIYRYSRALYLYWFGAIEYESGFDSPN